MLYRGVGVGMRVCVCVLESGMWSRGRAEQLWQAEQVAGAWERERDREWGRARERGQNFFSWRCYRCCCAVALTRRTVCTNDSKKFSFVTKTKTHIGKQKEKKNKTKAERKRERKKKQKQKGKKASGKEWKKLQEIERKRAKKKPSRCCAARPWARNRLDSSDNSTLGQVCGCVCVSVCVCVFMDISSRFPLVCLRSSLCIADNYQWKAKPPLPSPPPSP